VPPLAVRGADEFAKFCQKTESGRSKNEKRELYNEKEKAFDVQVCVCVCVCDVSVCVGDSLFCRCVCDFTEREKI